MPPDLFRILKDGEVSTVRVLDGTLSTDHGGTGGAGGVYQLLSEKAQPSGYASLGADGLVPADQLPAGAAPTDHGSLVGLADDDHPQYHTDARGDARYSPLSHASRTDNPHTVTLAQVGGEPAGAVAAHVAAPDPHAQYTTDAEATALAQTAAGAAITTHLAAADPHPQYTTVVEAGTLASTEAGFAITAHNADGGAHNNNLPTTAEKAALAGTSGAPGAGNKYVTNADARLTDARAPTAHAHTLDSLSDVTTAGATDAQALVFESATSTWHPATISTGGGVTDHGALTGLGDDDHTHYLNNARGDARYTPLSHEGRIDNPHAVTLAQVGGEAAGTMAAHLAAADPHAQYHNNARGDSRYAPLAHVSQTGTSVHGLGTASTRNVPAAGDAASAEVVLGVDSRLSNSRPPTAHAHVIADTTGLQTALDARQPLDATLTGLASLNTTGGFLVQTAPDVFTKRTLVGGTGVSISNADGGAGNPTVTNTDLGSAAVTTHEAAEDPHGENYLNLARGDVRYTNVAHMALHESAIGNAVHGLGTASTRDVPAAGNALAAEVVLGSDTRLTDPRPPGSHTHPISEVVALQTALDSKLGAFPDGHYEMLEGAALPKVILRNSTWNVIEWRNTGTGMPTDRRLNQTPSAGTKLLLYPASGFTLDFAIGVENGAMWFSVLDAVSTNHFKFYAGSAGSPILLADINGFGQLHLPRLGPTAGLLLGYDTNLYRMNPNHLRTDDLFECASLVVDGTTILNGSIVGIDVVDVAGLQTALDGKQNLDAALTALANLSATAGIMVNTGPDAFAKRSIVSGLGISVTTGDGVGGNPTIANTDRGTEAVTAHVATTDPHTQYQREAEKAVANGYASLDATGKVPAAQLPPGGVDDHGALSGLADDDHIQYLTAGRGDVRYAQVAHVSQTGTAVHGLGTASTRNVPATGNALSSEAVLGSDTRLSDARTPTSHTHTTSAVTGLDAALAGKQAADATLTALAGLTGTVGYLVQTGADAFAKRSIQAGNGMTVESSDGVTGNTIVHNNDRGSVVVANHEFTYNHGDLPTPDEKDALLGTSGIPAAGNRYVTNADSRLSDTRPPAAHGHVIADVTGLQTALNGKQPLDGTLTALAALSATGGFLVQFGADAFLKRTITASSGIAITNGDGVAANPAITLDGMAARQNTAPVTLTDGATISTNAALGCKFRVTLGGNRTLANVTGALDGQRIVWEIIQDATGGRTLALGTGFSMGTEMPTLTLTTTANAHDFLVGYYNSSTAKTYIVGFAPGYA